VRPWLQAFTLGAPAYGPDQLLAQKKAVYDAGYDGWVLWSPGSKYDGIASGLERHPVSHKKMLPLPATVAAAPASPVAGQPASPVAAHHRITGAPTATP
jgi:hypothetical protein